MKMYIFRLTLQNLHVLYCHITLVFLLTFHVFTIDIIAKTSRLQSFNSILTSKVRKELVPCTVATSHHRLQTPTEKLASHEAETIIISIYNFNLLTNVHQCKLAPCDAETSQLQFNSIQNVHNGDLSLTDSTQTSTMKNSLSMKWRHHNFAKPTAGWEHRTSFQTSILVTHDKSKHHLISLYTD